MTETMLPLRVAVCRALVARGAGKTRHEPRTDSVDSGYNHDIEWQFGSCRHCAEPISRFRPLLGGQWFDAWGSIDESEFVIDHHGPG